MGAASRNKETAVDRATKAIAGFGVFEKVWGWEFQILIRGVSSKWPAPDRDSKKEVEVLESRVKSERTRPQDASGKAWASGGLGFRFKD